MYTIHTLVEKMSNDLVNSLQNLIDSGKGDLGRLNYILGMLKQGRPLYASDQKYLDKMLAKNNASLDTSSFADVPQSNPDTRESQDNMLTNTNKDKLQNVTHKKKSAWWFLLPILFNFIGGIIAYFIIREDDPKRAKNCLWLGIILGGIQIAFIIIWAVFFSIAMSEFNPLPEDLMQYL